LVNAGQAIYEVIIASNAEAEFARIAASAKVFDATMQKLNRTSVSTGSNIAANTNAMIGFRRLMAEVDSYVARTTMSLTQRIKENVRSLFDFGIAIGNVRRKTISLGQALQLMTGLLKRETFATSLAALANSRLADSVEHVGVSLGNLNFRIRHQTLIVLSALATALVPIASGLLAVATAATTAAAAIAGLLGLGLYKWYRQWKEVEEGFGGYAGARRPYHFGRGGRGLQMWGFMGEVMAGIKAVMDTGEFARSFERLAEWTKKIFQVVLPNAFRAFLRHVNPQVVKMLQDLFERALPRLGELLAIFGSELLSLIGKGSIERINKVIKGIGRFLLGVARWLTVGDNFKQIDEFMKKFAKLLRLLYLIGDKFLPILNSVLDFVYKLLKFAGLLIVKVVDAIGANNVARLMKVALTITLIVSLLSGAIGTFIAVLNVLGVIYTIFGSIGFAALGVVGAITALTGVLMALSERVPEVAWFLANMGTAIRNFFRKIKNILTGSDEPMLEYKDIDWFREKIAERQAEAQMMGQKIDLNLFIDEGIVAELIAADLDTDTVNISKQTLPYGRQRSVRG